MKIPKIGDLVKVRWWDAHANSVEDFTQEDIKKAKLTIIVTYGILVRDDRGEGPDPLDGVVGIASESSSETTYRGVTFVPAVMVASVEIPRATRTKKVKTTPPPTPVPAPLKLPEAL